MDVPVYVLYGSQKGCAKDIAEVRRSEKPAVIIVDETGGSLQRERLCVGCARQRLHKFNDASGVKSNLLALNDYKKVRTSGDGRSTCDCTVFVMCVGAWVTVRAQLRVQVNLSVPTVFVVVCSTTGNGEHPENADMFWRWLRRRTHPKTLMENVYYSVLALGDTNYTKFWYAVRWVAGGARRLLAGAAVPAPARSNPRSHRCVDATQQRRQGNTQSPRRAGRGVFFRAG